MTTSSGGAFFFCWDTEAEEGKQFLKSFKAIGDIDKPDVFVQYCFLQSENTYFSEVWWNDLPEKTKRSLTKLAGTHYYEGGAYKPSGLPLVDWKITGFRES